MTAGMSDAEILARAAARLLESPDEVQHHADCLSLKGFDDCDCTSLFALDRIMEADRRNKARLEK